MHNEDNSSSLTDALSHSSWCRVNTAFSRKSQIKRRTGCSSSERGKKMRITNILIGALWILILQCEASLSIWTTCPSGNKHYLQMSNHLEWSWNSSEAELSTQRKKTRKLHGFRHFQHNISRCLDKVAKGFIITLHPVYIASRVRSRLHVLHVLKSAPVADKLVSWFHISSVNRQIVFRRRQIGFLIHVKINPLHDC